MCHFLRDNSDIQRWVKSGEVGGLFECYGWRHNVIMATEEPITFRQTYKQFKFIRFIQFLSAIHHSKSAILHLAEVVTPE
jgi:hypothetical protein